jgi:lipopolysaccharide export system protein LptA
LLWQLQAKSGAYQNDQRQGQVQNLVGQLYEQGVPVFRIESPIAQVQQQGNQLLIRGKTKVIDLRSKGLLTANEFLWRPETSTLIARQTPKLTYPVVQVIAAEMQANSRLKEVLALGKVVATSPVGVRLRTEQLLWQIEQQQFIAGKPGSGVTLEQLLGTGKGSQASGETLTFNVKTQTVQLQTDVAIRLTQPQLNISGQQFSWQIPARQISSSQPVLVRSPATAVRVSGNRGTFNLATEQVNFQGNVRAIGEKQESLLTTDQLTWQIPAQRLEAVGNVFYQQKTPRLTVRGGRAVGLIQTQQVAIVGSGGGGGQVTTEIIP